MSILSKIKHFFHPIQGEIWCLHRVVTERSIYPSNRELEITPEYLEKTIIKYQQREFQFVSMDELVAEIGHNSYDLRKKRKVTVSFDDGFRDIYENAFPILKKYNIPLTIYLTSDFPEGKADIWWIQLEQYADGNVDKFEDMMKRIYQSTENMRDVMHRITDTRVDHSLCDKLSLSWKQLGDMVDSGLCTIGGHSKTHAGLTRISEEEIVDELSESKRVIEQHLPVEVKHFSSPHSMENAAIRKMIRDAGYTTAVIGYGGNVRKGDDLYRLKRHYITQQ